MMIEGPMSDEPKGYCGFCWCSDGGFMSKSKSAPIRQSLTVCPCPCHWVSGHTEEEISDYRKAAVHYHGTELKKLMDAR